MTKKSKVFTLKKAIYATTGHYLFEKEILSLKNMNLKCI